MIAPDPTPPVSCRYGAPMGRHRAIASLGGCAVRLRRVPLDSGGYDRGGAYWGFPDDLWAYGDGETWAFIRARSRAAAITAIRGEYGEEIRFWREDT